MTTRQKTREWMTRPSLPLAIGLLWLMPAAVIAQDEPDAPPPCFAPCSQLMSSRAMIDSPANGSVEITDFIVDQRDGMILYVLIDAHTLLGDARRHVAVPYEALSWNSEENRYALHANREQLDRLPRFDEGNLAYLNDPNWLTSLRDAFGNQHDLSDVRRTFGDEFTLFFTKRDPESIDGRIKAINKRVKSSMGEEYFAITVEPREGDEQVILLAPADFMKNQKVDLEPGSDVQVTAVRAFDGKMQVVHVAQMLRSDGWQLRLRDTQGIPSWPTRSQPHDKSYYVLASHLDNGNLFAGDVEFGSVKQTVIEAHSGTVAFSVVSTGDLLNVNEILYPIPFQKLTAGADENLFIDLPAEKMQVAPKLSRKRLDDLKDADFVSRVLEYYGIDEKHPFDTGRASKWLAAAPPASGGTPGK